MKHEFSKKCTYKSATEVTIDICSKIKDYFIENGMRQRDIANVLDVTQSAISNQLNGRPFGINSAKITADGYENLGFAIPINFFGFVLNLSFIIFLTFFPTS